MRKGTIMQQINEGLWGVMVRMWIRGVSGQVSAISHQLWVSGGAGWFRVSVFLDADCNR